MILVIDPMEEILMPPLAGESRGSVWEVRPAGRSPPGRDRGGRRPDRAARAMTVRAGDRSSGRSSTNTVGPSSQRQVRRDVEARLVASFLAEAAARRRSPARIARSAARRIPARRRSRHSTRSSRAARWARSARALGRSDVPGERVDQRSVDVEDPTAGLRRRTRARSSQRAVAKSHYRYTLFPMKHPWDQRLGFWYIAGDRPEIPAIVASPSGLTLSFGELAGRAHQLVHALRARGLETGDIIGVRPAQRRRHRHVAPGGSGGGIPVHLAQPGVVGSGDPAHRRSFGCGGRRAARRLRRSGRPADRHWFHPPACVPWAVPFRAGSGYESFVEGHPVTEPADRRLGIPISYSSGTTGQPKAVVRPSAPKVDPSVAADRAQELRPRVPVPSLRRCPPGLGGNAPRRLPGFLSRRARTWDRPSPSWASSTQNGRWR